MDNIFITGVNGFVGSALAERFLNEGHRVVGLVRDFNYKSRKDILDKISVVQGDLRDKSVINYALSQYEITKIFHVGAVSILRKSVVDPITAYETNVLGTVYLLEAARQQGVEKVVIASSDKSYGTYNQLPYVEDMHVQSSNDAYSTSKACTDLVAQQYAKGYGMDISILRAGNIYGPGDLNMSRLIPGSVLRCLDGIQPVLYKGVAQYKREFMYIDDVVDAYLLLSERGLPGEAYNVGGSGYQSILNTVEKIIKLTGNNFKPEIRDKDFIEIKEQYLDSSKIEKLGWQCKNKINTGLEKTIEWYRQYRGKVNFFTNQQKIDTQ
jgi:CDP-glucose 4,6-dehydratase